MEYPQTMMKTLSAKQQSILRFIRDFIREHDYPPSIRDIQEACGISSTSVVDYNLKALERLGHIRRDREVSRAIELVGRRKSMSIPVVGQIAAGIPIAVPETFEHQEFEDDVDVPSEVAAGHDNVFALRVKGTSMIDALVNDGDIVVLEGTQAWQDGDMVAAWIKSKEETTLKRIYHEGERIRLQPANVTMDPIYASADDVEVQGRVLYRIGGF
jgi:repressor LexA